MIFPARRNSAGAINHVVTVTVTGGMYVCVCKSPPPGGWLVMVVVPATNPQLNNARIMTIMNELERERVESLQVERKDGLRGASDFSSQD